MNKVILLFVAVLIIALTETQAQNLDNRAELGIRINSNDSPFSAAIDGTYNISKGNRIHADLGIGNGGFGVDFIHDWIFSFDGNRRFVFYPGVGGSLYFINDDIVLGITGEVGLEYRFSIPISLGIDYRPTFNLLPETNLISNGLGVNLRYRF